MTALLKEKPQSALNPWLIILLTAPVPIFLCVFVVAKWYRQKTDFTRVTTHFVQRQNTVMAYDAMEVSTGVSDLLEKTARDVRLMALLPLSAASYQRFHAAQISDYTQFYTESELPRTVALPFFNRQTVMSPKGEVLLHLIDGKVNSSLKTKDDCRNIDLCDRELVDQALKLPPGGLRYGRVMRYYAGEGEKDDDTSASLSVAYRDETRIYFLAIDFRHLRDHMTTPAFPYEVKRNLLQAYENGNYIYVVDSSNNIIIHPKYWHQMGVDRKTGDWRAPMRTDADDGRNPINVAAYESGKLKEYFTRLITQSFVAKGVDIFKAPNLKGTIRVLSVAPILLSKGQYAASGKFGHAIIGCAVDYFEEPKEKLVPYY